MSGAVEGKKAGGRRAFEHLRMDRRSMALPDRMIRVFNGRGAASVRDKTVTGLQGLQFPPVELRDYRFQLAFFDRRLAAGSRTSSPTSTTTTAAATRACTRWG